MATKFVILLSVLAASAVAVEPRKTAKVNLVREGETYRGHVEANDQLHELNLRSPSQPALHSNFKLIVAEDGPNGETIFRDASPTPQEMYEFEKNIFIDPKAGASVRISHHEDGEIRLHGILGGFRITHDGDDHVLTLHDHVDPTDYRAMDYADSNITLTYKNGYSPDSKQSPTKAIVELLFILDYQMWQSLEENSNFAVEYLSILIHGVNNRYDTNDDPKVTFQIVYAHVCGSLEQQPFLEYAKVPDGSGDYDMILALEKFSFWMYALRDHFPQHDLSPLLSGSGYKTKDESGVYKPGMLGYAWIRSACHYDHERNYTLKGSISSDKGAFWTGVFVVAHELAHNMGAPHDGDKEAAPCPWADGYVMSYEGWGNESKFYFSSCSKNLMKALINSDQGSCLRSQSGETWPAATRDAGDFLSLTQQCQKYIGRYDAFVDPDRTPDQICKNLRCRWPTPCDDGVSSGCYRWGEANMMPGDNSPCNNQGGKCWNGWCVKR